MRCDLRRALLPGPSTLRSPYSTISSEQMWEGDSRGMLLGTLSLCPVRDITSPYGRASKM